MPKISVIIPIYNSEKYLEECLDSILNQTLKDIEIICVDDGSTDNSLTILENYAQRDKRIQIFSQQNLHAGIARNHGLEKASGEYVHFMDSDDLLIDNNVYENLYKIIKSQKNINIIKFRNKAFDDSTKEYTKNDKYELKIVEEKFINNFMDIENDLYILSRLTVTPWSGIYRKEFLTENNIKFNNLKCCNDRSFNIITLLKSKKCFVSDIFVVYHRINTNSLIRIRDKHFDCQFESINIINEYLEKNVSNTYIKKSIFLSELRDLFSFYNRFIKTSQYSYEIYKKTLNFIKTIDSKNLEPELRNEYFYQTFLDLKKNDEFKSKLKNLIENNPTKKIAFWGASLFLENILEDFDIKKENIIGIIDRNTALQGLEKFGYKIFSPEILNQNDINAIILTIQNNNEIIYKDLGLLFKKNYPKIELLPNIFK